MIAGIFHQGSGLGDQLFRYITVRTLAKEKEYEWAMCNQSNFKGRSFMELDMGKDSMFQQDLLMNAWNEKDIRDANGVDIRSYDPEINFVEDNTLIDGSFEDSKYWGHNLENINKWLKVEPLEVSDDVCVIGFRGGEYQSNPDLFLGTDYWNAAIEKMGEKNYEVHTDDPLAARKMFGPINVVENTPLSHSKHTNMGLNWRAMRYSKNAIIANSAFYILPRLLKHLEDPTAVTYAPRYWARRNRGVWARPSCYYKQFTYL